MNGFVGIGRDERNAGEARQFEMAVARSLIAGWLVLLLTLGPGSTSAADTATTGTDNAGAQQVDNLGAGGGHEGSSGPAAPQAQPPQASTPPPGIRPETRQRLEALVQRLQQQIPMLEGDARELGESLLRDAEALERLLSQWLGENSEWLMQEFEQLLERSLEDLERRMPPPQSNKPVEI